MGVAKTTCRTKERSYRVSVHSVLQNWCRSYDICASRRGPPKTMRALIELRSVGRFGVPLDQGRNFKSAVLEKCVGSLELTK